MEESHSLRVGVVFGGRSTEHRVSIVSARTVAEALRSAGHRMVPLAIAQDGCWVEPAVGLEVLSGARDALEPVGTSVRASLAVLASAEIDAAFPIVHGTWGEDGTLQGLFEMLDVPYVGADVTSSAVCMDKLLCKRVLSAAGLPVVDYEAVSKRQRAATLDDPEAEAALTGRALRLGLPLFVKPTIGGSSVGVRKVTSREEILPALDSALSFASAALIETAIDGRELECAVLGPSGAIEASGLGEIVPGREFYDYADKYLEDGAQLIHRAELEPAVEAELRRLSAEAFEAVGGSGLARVDFLLDAEGPKINEINTLPGFTAISMYPKLWRVAGVETPQLVDRLVGIAVDRHRERRDLDVSIRSLLASLAE
ncbi:MAG: D-alanine--D-alanine ligase family protein [Acidobacteriota bacterium]